MITTSPVLLRNADIILVVFDLSKPDQFQLTRRWLTKAFQLKKDHCSVILVCNKIDLFRDHSGAPLDHVSTDSVSEETLNDVCDDFGIEVVDVSAKEGWNIDSLFKDAAKERWIFSRIRRIG